MQDTREYRAIAAHYGTRTALASGQPLIRHIDQGLKILERIGASDLAQRAFCLPPLVQADADLAANISRLRDLTDDVQVIALALEYRNIANATLSTRMLTRAEEIRLSPLPDVNAMLVADKVQNRADYLRFHRDTHARSEELDRYFRLWLERLGINEERYTELAAL